MGRDGSDKHCGRATDDLIDVIRFWLRHDYRSLKSIADACAVDNGNLHGALSGRRKLSLDNLGKVAYALGIVVSCRGSDLELSVVPNTVHFLELSRECLPTLPILNRIGFSLAKVVWAESPPEDGRHGAFVFIRVGSRTLAIYCADAGESQGELIARQVAGVIGGAMVGGYSPTLAQWLCWRCHKANPTDFDTVFGARKSATIAEWANLLIRCETLGVCPEDLRKRFLAQSKQKSIEPASTGCRRSPQTKEMR